MSAMNVDKYKLMKQRLKQVLDENTSLTEELEEQKLKYNKLKLENQQLRQGVMVGSSIPSDDSDEHDDLDVKMIPVNTHVERSKKQIILPTITHSVNVIAPTRTVNGNLLNPYKSRSPPPAAASMHFEPRHFQMAAAHLSPAGNHHTALSHDQIKPTFDVKHPIQGAVVAGLSDPLHTTAAVKSERPEPSTLIPQSSATSLVSTADSVDNGDVAGPPRKRQKSEPKRKRYHELPKGSTGHVILPHQIGVITIESLGEIVPDRTQYFNARHIFPVGYKSSRFLQVTQGVPFNNRSRGQCTIHIINRRWRSGSNFQSRKHRRLMYPERVSFRSMGPST
jgi:F/Y-rich N-terminus